VGGSREEMRVLNLDLDFFVHGVAHWKGHKIERLDPAEYPPWSVDDSLLFLETKCGLHRKLPGFAVDYQDEIFRQWRTAIEEGIMSVPFHVTHVDAHADLGLGDAAYVYLMTEVLLNDPDHRTYPNEGGPRGLSEGNYLAFAVACRWISDLVYVFNDGGGSDIPRFLMQNFDPSADHIELKAIRSDDVTAMLHGRVPEVIHREPVVTLRSVPYRQFQADGPYDMICLARSPTYTPQSADAIYDEIRRRFISEPST
jgi:hypothetical protein